MHHKPQQCIDGDVHINLKKTSKHSHLCVYFFVQTVSKHLKFPWWSQKCCHVLCGGRVEVAASSRVMLQSETSCTAFWERTKQMVVHPSKTSLHGHYFPTAQKRWGHPYLRDWNIREYLAWTHPVLPAEDTQTRVREWEREGEREGEGRGDREKRSGSGHLYYGFQFWQLKAPQGLLCTGTCNRVQKIRK